MFAKTTKTFNYQMIRQFFARSIVIESDQAQDIVVKTKIGSKSWRDIPGPRSLPLIGPLHNFLPGGLFYKMDRIEFTEQIYRMYGPIVKLDKLFNQPPTVFLFDADSVSMVLRAENWLPHRPTIKSLETYVTKYRTCEDVKIHSLAMTQGQEWKDIRTKLNPVMMNSSYLTEVYTKVLNEVAMDAITRLRDERNKQLMIPDFDTLMRLFALESTGAIVLGSRLNCLNSNLLENSRELKLIELINRFFEHMENLDFKPNAGRYLNSRHFKEAMKTYNELERTVRYYVIKWKNNFHKDKNMNNENCILKKLLEIDEATAFSMGLDTLIGGVDTITASTMVLLYHLGINPDKQSKLREEISTGKERGPYLKACLKESMRMAPVAIANTRFSSKSYNILGYDVPPGVLIVTMHSTMSLMERNYPRPEEYLPERWLVDKQHPLYIKNSNPLVSAPFGFGARVCIGRRIAELTMETLIARMVENFEISWEGPPPKFSITTLTQMNKPFYFVLKDI